MKLHTCWKAFALASYLVVVANFANAQTAPAPHWGYSGQTGPNNWGKLEPDFVECSMGHAQSPIDIKGARKADLPALQFDYNAVPLSIVDNGHTVMVNYAAGSTVKIGDKTYTLKQFHFHHPSEEEINGMRYDLGAHLVHSDAEGHLAVVAILFKEGATPSPLLDTLWKNVSAEKEKVVEISSVSINVKDLLPPTTGYYTFTGSLTTPPCSEGVTWYVLNTPVSISRAQLDAFAKIYKHDARPLQPTNHREILESR